MDAPRTFHLHMISDATGETLVAVAKAVRVQYSQVRAIEHIHPLVRSKRELERVLKDVEATPGIVLYTIVNPALVEQVEQTCKRLNIPCVPVLKSILQVFESYLGMASTPTVAGQHVLDADYFRRIEALNFTMLHDDGHLPENLDDADILLLGISRTSKTPTSIYLANRGYKTANVPLIPGVKLPPKLEARTNAFVVGLVAKVGACQMAHGGSWEVAPVPEFERLVRTNNIWPHTAHSFLQNTCGSFSRMLLRE